jgi:2-octaprenyl-6-methoxyphenol hydroxylase
MSADTDIAIIGGGPVGAALALALRQSALRVAVLEARTEPAHETRPMALSHGSRLLLERLGVWQALRSPTPIKKIHVSQRGGFGRVTMSAADLDLADLGYVIDYIELFRILSDAVRATYSDAKQGGYHEGARAAALTREADVIRVHYTQHDGAAAMLTTQWVIAADGGELDGLAPPATRDYAQHALTARVGTTLRHNHVAYERFTQHGPLALLPYENDYSLVWMHTPAHVTELMQADDTTFLTALRETFGARAGEFTRVTRRASYPLSLRYTTRDTPGVITIGNAAQTLHPVAGQGFNLGLRDAWELAQILCGLSPQALTHNEALRAYRARRRVDRTAMISATHGLVQLFSNDFLPLRVARGAGMTLLGAITPLRNFVARRMIFGARG